MIFFCNIYVIEAALRPSFLNSSLASSFFFCLQRVKPSVRDSSWFRINHTKNNEWKKMTRKSLLTCCCPQQRQVSGGGFHICLALQLLLENQNSLHIIFYEKISILHAHVNVPEKKSEVRRALKRSLRSKSSTLGTCKNEVLMGTALLRSQNCLFDTEITVLWSQR